jgi:hypothetical protein
LFGLRKKRVYSVTPTSETAKAKASTRYPLEDGRSYLAHDPRTGFEVFASLVRGGREGLLITRAFPEDVRKDYGIQTTPIRWLAEEDGQDAIQPGDLLGISLTVKDFLEKATKPAVMLHGIEYLTTYNGFTPVLRLIQGFSESIATRRGIMVLPIVQDSLNKQDEALLVAETTPLPMPAGS